MTTVSHGKPYAGNPHVRFDEGDPASAEPRRKSLLHRPGPWQILICIAVVALLFGAKKIPEIARSLGRAKSEFKKGLLEGEKENALE